MSAIKCAVVLYFGIVHLRTSSPNTTLPSWPALQLKI
uniref:Uncharacterized protein n=1 Tax=Anguilla anguilla TaxID=7936 RepID=A0A0E9UYG8_ANGAN